MTAAFYSSNDDILGESLKDRPKVNRLHNGGDTSWFRIDAGRRINRFIEKPRINDTLTDLRRPPSVCQLP